jgi:propanol-preferring alcohol dehydrogenase
MRITAHGAYGVIVTAAFKEGYITAPLILRPAGTMVCVGISKDPTVIAGAPPIVIVLRKLNVVGTVVGTLKDAEEALDFTARGLVHSIFKKGTLKNLDLFCELIQTGKLAGRAVLKIAV